MVEDQTEKIACSGWTADAVGPGWKNLVEPLLMVCKQNDVTVLQIKEKFGTLRFYVGSVPEWIANMIVWAEHLSAYTCEECGAKNSYGWYASSEEIAKGKTVQHRDTGWIKTWCDECAEKRYGPDNNL